MYNDQNNLDKVFITLHPKYVLRLEDDARNFEILKPGNMLNMNSFLNMLIKGYYEQFSNVDEYLINASHFDVLTDTQEKRKRITIRPSKDNRSLFSKIISLHSERDGISGYFSKLLMSYCELAMYKREQIVFSNNYEELRKYTNPKTRSRITFKIKGSENIHEVIPYKVVISKEEMFNYLLCSELRDGKPVATPFRLNRIDCIDSTPGETIISTDVERHLKLMEQYAPQYGIEEDTETCVRLTAQGVNEYRRIYFGRPDRILDKDEEREDGTYYYFECSTNQIYLYFRRFGCNAEIIYPKDLRDKISEFHHNAASIYEKG